MPANIGVSTVIREGTGPVSQMQQRQSRTFCKGGGSTFVGSVLVKNGITCVAHGTEFGANPITLGESGQG